MIVFLLLLFDRSLTCNKHDACYLPVAHSFKTAKSNRGARVCQNKSTITDLILFYWQVPFKSCISLDSLNTKHTLISSFMHRSVLIRLFTNRLLYSPWHTPTQDVGDIARQYLDKNRCGTPPLIGYQGGKCLLNDGAVSNGKVDEASVNSNSKVNLALTDILSDLNMHKAHTVYIKRKAMGFWNRDLSCQISQSDRRQMHYAPVMST